MIDDNTLKKILSHIESNFNREELIKLTSNSNMMTITDQIRYFSFFLKKSLEYDDKSTVVDILPWMYHAFGSQGFKEKYFLFLYDMWLLSGKKFLDDNTYNKLEELINHLCTVHERIVKESRNYTTKIDEIPQNFKEKSLKFKDALLKGDSTSAREMYKSNVNSFEELQEFYNYIIYPSMVEVGKAWENGTITPAGEHLASSIVLEILTLLYTKIELPVISKSKIVIGTVTNEFHEIGATMLANALEAKGFDVEYLGYNIPNENFLSKIKEINPMVVALSVAMPFNLDNTAVLVKEIKKLDKNITIMVGGGAFSSKKLCEEKCGADIYLKDINDGVKEMEYLFEQRNIDER